MSRNLSWRHGYRYCDATTREGKPCGNLVPVGVRKCTVHRRMAERARASSDRASR